MKLIYDQNFLKINFLLIELKSFIQNYCIFLKPYLYFFKKNLSYCSILLRLFIMEINLHLILYFNFMILIQL